MATDLQGLLMQQEHAQRLASLEGRVNGMSDRLGQVSRRVDRTNLRLRQIEAQVARCTEILKWIGVAALMLAGLWDKLPEPLRARLLGD